MKKLLCILVVLSVFTFNAQSEDKSYGCGLGRLAAPKNTLSSTTTAATVDYLLPSRASATTSGTSGCKKHDLVLNERIKEHYVEANIELIKIDAAIGSGEYVVGLARTFGCRDSSVDEFAKYIQQKYKTLFIKNSASINTVKNINNLIIANEKLSESCSLRS